MTVITITNYLIGMALSMEYILLSFVFISTFTLQLDISLITSDFILIA